MYYNKGKDEIQEKWRPKKMNNVKVSESFIRLRMYGRAERLRNCSTWLKFAECPEDGFKRLVDARFCRDRLCPLCNWRRSRKLYSQILQILHKAGERRKLRYLFLTLTVRNVSGDDLPQTLDVMFKGVNQLFKYKAVDKNLVGWIRNLEITYNATEDTYHPHFHILLGVQPSYFHSGEYISQAIWTQLWRKAAVLDYTPVVNIKAVKPKQTDKPPLNARTAMESAVLETAKYSVKDSDYLRATDAETDAVVAVFAGAVRSRRMVGFGKMFKIIRKELKQDDVESDKVDLLDNQHSGCGCPVCQSTLVEKLIKWNFVGGLYNN